MNIKTYTVQSADLGENVHVAGKACIVNLGNIIYFYSFTHYEMGSLELRKDENPFR
ncbi:MAG: hypothetical protein ISR34_11130 [Pirellulales bacterium]|nr:hypothetical protein [Pirellulales bacterium]